MSDRCEYSNFDNCLSPYFTENCDTMTVPSISERFLEIEIDLVNELKDFNTKLQLDSSVEYIYNPLEYAYSIHANFVHKFCKTAKKILFLGMNPGPWGMMQTGVPFGDVNSVKNWLKVTGDIRKPLKEHHLRPITGLDCKRVEVSGKRFWAFAQHLSDGNPQTFFSNSFVHNYFPFVLLTGSGKNITPADLKLAEQKVLESVCDKSLCAIIDLLQVETIIAIGRYTEKRVKAALKDSTFSKNVNIVTMDTKNVPSPSHSHWKKRNRPNLKKIKLSEATKARDNMAEYINERRSVMEEELKMLREKHAEEIEILKMRREMCQEKHAEEMEILKVKRENEVLQREALKLKIEFYKKN